MWLGAELGMQGAEQASWASSRRAGTARGSAGGRKRARARSGRRGRTRGAVGAGTHGERQALARTGSGTARQCRREAGARQGRSKRAGCARPGRTGWLRAVHSVHTAYFRSGLTRYCS